MKKTAIFFFISTILCVAHLSAQFMDKVQLKSGFIYGSYLFNIATDSSYTYLNPLNGGQYVNLYFGGYYAAAHKNDIVSTGVDAGIQGWIGLGNLSYQLQLPVYVMGRIGAGATRYNQQKFGFALGVGMQTSYRGFFSQRYVDIAPKFFSIPSAVAEVVIGGNRNFIGRLYLTPFPTKKHVKDPNSYYTVANFGLGLLYRLN